jgi:RNA polymerase sigma factor (sigma-70 family)
VIVVRMARHYGRVLREAELQRLDDDALIAHLRTAGGESARTALAILVYGHWHNVARRVSLKVPSEAVEDVTGEVLISAIQSAFDGSSIGEFSVWLRTITQRRIADFHRRRAATTVPIDDVTVIAPADDEVELNDLIERLLARLNAEHRRVVELVVLQGRGAAEIDGVSVANVHQITSRFRRALREELDTG